MKADLHIHTTYSDGFCTPKEIVQRANELDLRIISITDHDNLSGIKETQEYAAQYGIEVIPGVELSSDIGDFEVHILGYFLDIDNEELNRYLQFFRDERLKRTERILHKLKLLGVPLVIDDVYELAQNCAVGRPHIAQALVKKGFVDTYQEAFSRFLGNGAPAYEKKIHISPSSAFKIISDAGGLSFIAHPSSIPDNLITDLVKSGVDGIEVVHPSYSPQQKRLFKEIANQYFLLQSGGSDFHGGKRNDDENLGEYYINSDIVEKMRDYLVKNRA